MTSEAAILQSIEGEPMTLEGVAAKGSVNGLLFELTVEQRYCNPSKANIEAVYTFPLPFGAVLLDLDVELNGKTLTGIVVEKAAAEAQYEDAIDKGDTAIMLERAANGLCTVNLGNLMAGERAAIRYRYSQLLRFEQGSVRLTVPTVIAPRYGNPADAGLAPHQAPATDLLAEYPFTLSLLLQGAIAAGAVASPSHAITTTAMAEGVEVSIARKAHLDRDFVLTVGGLAGQSLATVGRDGDGYVALASFCAKVPSTAAELPLRLKLVVDCSGSMNGDSIAAAKRAMHRILERLTPADRFSLTRFGSHFEHDIDHLCPAEPAAILMASQLVARMGADLGGTEMEGALTAVFALGGEEVAADLLLVTDGEIWNADSLVARAKRSRQRVFVVGIGTAPAEGVLRQIAEATGGACEFVAPNEDTEAGILRMFNRLRAPRIEHADIVWPQSTKWMTPLPTSLFGGETIHVCAGFDAPPSGGVLLKLMPVGDAKPLTAQASLPKLTGDTTLARMAAASRLPLAEADEQLALALKYSLLTDRTTFLVIHQRAEGEKAQELPQLRKVAQMHAAGWGGVGSVSMNLNCVDVLSAMRSTSTSSRRFGCARSDRSVFEGVGDLDIVPDVANNFNWQAPANSIDEFLTALDKRFLATLGGQLPATFAELAELGVGADVLKDLRSLADAGQVERDVVRAYLEALVLHAIQASASRHLIRALRNQFRNKVECRDLRAAVAAIVGEISVVEAPGLGSSLEPAPR